jgi:hypothetical protein
VLRKRLAVEKGLSITSQILTRHRIAEAIQKLAMAYADRFNPLEKMRLGNHRKMPAA